MKRKLLHQSKYPFNKHPFEASRCGSWQSVELIEVRHGALAFHFADSHHGVEEKGPFPDIRIKSRQATLSDCTCFLRPGIDVCVLLTAHKEGSEEGNRKPVWLDGKINSIERKPHESECSCQFFVNVYVNQGSLGSEIKGPLGKKTQVVGIDQISILQRLGNSPCEGQFYRWDFSEDCFSLQKTKLFLGRFSSDLTWLLVASVMKKIAFDVTSARNKIIYQILGVDDNLYSLRPDNSLSSLSFKVENDVLTPTVLQFIPNDDEEIFSDLAGPDQLPSSDIMNLRRSKRRNVKPERFVGCDDPPVTEFGRIRALPYKPRKWKDEELHIPLAQLFSVSVDSCSTEEQTARRIRICSSKGRPSKDLSILKTKTKRRLVNSDVGNKRGNENQLAIVAVPTEDDQVALESLPFAAKTPGTDAQVNRAEKCNSFSNVFRNSGKIKPGKSSWPAKSRRKCSGMVTSETSSSLAKNTRKYSANMTSEQFRCPAKAPRKYLRRTDEISPGYHNSRGSPASQRKIGDELEDLVLESGWGRDASPQNVDRSYQKKNVESRAYRRVRSRRDASSELMTSKKSFFNKDIYNKLINSYMNSIDTTINSKEEEPHIIDHWKEFKAKSFLEQQEKMEPHETKEEGENSDLEALWREMELCLASAFLFEENEVQLSAQTVKTNSGGDCKHEFRLDEEIGLLCSICGFVRTEIKYVSAPFMECRGSNVEEKLHSGQYSKQKLDADEGLNFSGHHATDEDMILPGNTDTAWDLIPELRMKLHAHQKKAFEFLWRNVAGGMVPELIEKESKKIGGCVISHSPGAGKTFLIISFLVSYLKLFPGKRPLVLAPKTTLYTWYKEFIKWEIPVPVHLLHGRKTYRVFRQRSGTVGTGPVQNEDAMHILDSLEKVQKWHAQPSILLMSYSSFLTLMQENSRFTYRKYMAKVLRESPGLLILDEGHNPRSTKSRLRKVLMKVETDLRILLSGTLFQNNFCEYFNTLCLARPKFIKEVMQELDPKFKENNKRMEKAKANLSECRSRKFFIDKIASKIDSHNTEERKQGLNMLKKMTNAFIDVYEGGSSDMLPGLQIYTIMMNSTDAQREILLKLQKVMETYDGYPLELELLITLAAIHPWLIKTSMCVNKFYKAKELIEFEKLKFDARKGSKVMFVLDLVYRVAKKEKVLMFCHNIAPIKLFVELFETVFRWQRGKEILVLTGDLELFERGRIMDQFEESSVSRVLLASITACAEGISLTAASRVIMLDSEWNPSKTKQAIARAFRPGQQKVVYVYQLLATGTIEEDKYRRTTWKEWVSSMIFSQAFAEDPSRWQAEKIEDDVLREMVEEDRVKTLKLFNKIMKNEKASTGRARLAS